MARAITFGLLLTGLAWTTPPAYARLTSKRVLMAYHLVAVVAQCTPGAAIPYLPFAGALGFVPLPWTVVLAVVAITVFYAAATELQKRWVFRRSA